MLCGGLRDRKDFSADTPGTTTESSELGDGKDCGISILCGGHTGSPRKSPRVLGTRGWEGQWDFSAV